MIVGEVFRIKDVLLNSQDEPDSILFDSLRRLQLMELTVDVLKATEIGKVVNSFRRHSSKQTRHLAQTIIDGWKGLVDEWVSATEAIVEGTPESMNPSVVDEEVVVEEEEGLPSPPLDEGAFFATQPTSMELSQFFDGMDDDGNPQSNAEFKRNWDSGRKPSQENQTFSKGKKKTSSKTNLGIKDDKSQQMKRLEPVAKPNSKPSSINTGSGIPQKNNVEKKPNSEPSLLKTPDKMAVLKKPLSCQQDKLKTSDELSVQQKLEATKRKLQERYQQAENAKRKRTIQVMELHDLPKQGSSNNNHNRHWLNRRR
ncbi:Transcription elongation factor family protein, putative isoform 2 [Hibiscus syriacus]|uniref:Transcription elongation factor family protein, putative isoform 2 n=2 Tax=Hibiscus syriacus TaxID=106335 RepID=A0A6A2WNJ6_HIBSY|nr:Transcription elongation factor family protein, putative isoform 2 [Hibiscus syriacus]